MLHPIRDWIVLLCFSIIILVVVGLVGFFMAKPLPIDPTSTEAPRVRTLSREKLSATVKMFADKKAAFDSLWNSKPSYTSP